MSLVIPYTELVSQLQAVITSNLSSDTLCLFTGSHTPALGDGTIQYIGSEPAFGGYIRQPMTAWTAAALNSSSIATTTGQVFSWTATAGPYPVTVTGVFALDSSGALAFAELFPGGPVTITANGQSFSYQPTVTLGESAPFTI
jgi:hypothetical protein